MAVKIVIDVRQNSRNISNFTTNVTVKVNAVWTGGSFNQLEKSGVLYIDGTKYTFTSPFNTGETTSGSCNLYTKTLDIKHKTDGTKTLALSASYNSGVSSGVVAASASVELLAFPVASTMSITGSKSLGSSQKITITKMNSTFTTTLTYTCGQTSTTLLSKSKDTSITFNVPLDLARYNTTGTSVTVTYTLTTFGGSTQIGSVTNKVTYSIPSSVTPSCSVSVSDGKGYEPTYRGYIQGHSTFAIAVGAQGAYGSTIRSYKVTANGSVYSTKNVTTAPIKNSGNNTISVEVTDSRGRKATTTHTVNVLPYSPPKITDMQVVRANNDTSLKLAFSYSVSTLKYSEMDDPDEHISGEVRYKKTTEADYKSFDLDALGAYGQSAVTFAADPESSYDVVLIVEDPFASTSRARVGPPAHKLFSIHRNHNGWAFGKRAEMENAIDNGWPTYHRGSAYFDTNMKIYGKTVDGEYKNIFEPVNDNGNTVIGYGNYDAASGNTNIYGHDVWFGVSDIASPGMHRPYLRRGDEFNVTIQTAGYVTNSKRDISFMVPLNMPIVGGPTITASSVNGFVFRQGGHYVYGSSSSVSVHPTSYDCAGAFRYGIRVTAHFPVGEDAERDEELNEAYIVNNDTIGVYWSGKITLS